MKINGKTIEGPSVVVVVIPRSTGDIVFKAKAVLDFSDFEAIAPAPVPPKVMVPGGMTSTNVEDPQYKEELNKYAELKTHWLTLKSLSATDDLEWETVDMSDTDTWGNYIKELESSGFSIAEIANIIGIITDANGLNQDKIDEATKRFLAGAEEVKNVQ